MDVPFERPWKDLCTPGEFHPQHGVTNAGVTYIKK